MAEDFAEKTEAPTPHRRQEARRAGNVARSAELSAAVISLASVLLLHQTGGDVAKALTALVASGLSLSSGISAANIGYVLAVSAAPLLCGLVIIAVAVNLLQIGWLFRFRADSSALKPGKGFARIFSGRSVAQLLMNVLKLSLVGVVTYFAARDRMAEIVGLQDRPLAEIVPTAAGLFVGVAVRIGVLLLVLGVIDYAYQRFRYERDLRMTRREVTDEMRRLEGDPLHRGRRKSMAAARSATTLQRGVMSADAVIVGGGVAAAIRYDETTMLAPRVTVKGRGRAAREIQEAAERQGILVVERERLALAIFAKVGTGQDAPSRFYRDIADVLAFAHSMKGRRAT